MKTKTREVVLVAVFSVFMAVCAWITVPGVVPFTMQSFAVFLALCLLGAKHGTVAILLYLLLGALGLPVFSNFTAGVGVLLGPNGGYMIGWLLMGAVLWLVEIFGSKKPFWRVAALVLGQLLCYAVGTVWFIAVYTVQTGPVGVGTALIWCVVPFVLPDFAKLFLALWMTKRLQKVLKICV